MRLHSPEFSDASPRVKRTAYYWIMMSEEPEMMSPQVLADFLHVPLATVYGWRHKGGGPPASKVGRHLRYRRNDVELWLDECRTGR